MNWPIRYRWRRWIRGAAARARTEAAEQQLGAQLVADSPRARLLTARSDSQARIHRAARAQGKPPSCLR
ncbi:hypothetical protein [Nocardia sp. NPDC051832]|uniref:hypothetical protein n=1 Tax=Nocardia sp. NPDC051832 TaxID=3155673 RepID=UPI003432A46B